MTLTLHTLARFLNPWRTIRRLEAENRRLEWQASDFIDEVSQLRWRNQLLKDELATDNRRGPRLGHCSTHGLQPSNDWGCPKCVGAIVHDLGDAREQLATAKEALWRLQRWGGWPLSPVASWDVDTTVAVADWLQRGMTGPLPPLPEHLTQRKGQPDAEQGL
jgi:hypothetical protein